MSDRSNPPKVSASVVNDDSSHPHAFQLSYGRETILLEPGRSWFQIDHHKWVTRGIIEEPQSFHVHPDGQVDLNGSSFPLTDPEGLTQQLNRHHLPPAGPAPLHPQHHPKTPPDHSLHYRVRLDHFGHLLIEAKRGNDRVESGIRGLQHLAHDGWIRPPATLHVDPLQRYVEIDGVRFDATEDGARQLAEALHTLYLPPQDAHLQDAILVRENSGASTGFDIHFWIQRAGARFEVKGHLDQQKLDLLQDRDRCDLLLPGVLLRLSPPYLYFRQRHPDGSEGPIPDLPDLKYRGLSAPDLQRVLNHPALLKAGHSPSSTTPTPNSPSPTPRPLSPDMATAGATAASSPPSTDRPGPSPTNQPLPTPNPAVAPRPPSRSQPPPLPPILTPAQKSTPLPSPPLPPEIAARFPPMPPGTLFTETFAALTEHLHYPVQDRFLDLPHIFQHRRFEILDFHGDLIESVLQLRGDRFYGFYLAHLGGERRDLVYACHGTHLEWGESRCSLLPSLAAEPVEFSAPALHGLAQDDQGRFVFLVDPAYHRWIQPWEPLCLHACARFLTLAQWSEDPRAFPLLYPAPLQG